TRYHDAASLLPAMGAELSFTALPTGIGGRIAQSRQQTLKRGRQTGHYSVLRAMCLQFLEHRIVTEAGIGAKPQLADFGRHVHEARLQERGAPLPCASVPGA